tara:strand:- start:48 stop:683 length:636 start_codon:yes stop_codon:yes gene_type:complete
MTLKLNGSSSGSVSLDAPASTTGGADVTFKLPVADGLAGQVLTTNASGQLEWKYPSLAFADHWRLTTEFSGDQDPITNAVERVDTAGQGYIGSAMTVSSGVWTFPSTGIWQVSFHSEHSHSSLEDRNVQSWIKVTTDNGSNWTEIAKSSIQATNDSTNAGTHNDVSTLIDVTDVGQVKVAFKVDTTHASTQIKASSTYNRTSFTFLRLGDT